MNKPILSSQNKEWGFYGTIDRCGFEGIDADTAWELAFHAVGKATDAEDEDVRFFLDSRHGRHFADDVINGLCTGLSFEDATDAAVDRWMNWTISRRTSRDTGIPAGFPYLTGFVKHTGVEA